MTTWEVSGDLESISKAVVDAQPYDTIAVVSPGTLTDLGVVAIPKPLRFDGQGHLTLEGTALRITDVSDFVLRGVRIRCRKLWNGEPGTKSGIDSLSIRGSRVLIDQCSLQYGTDECVTVHSYDRRGEVSHVTVQRSIISDGLDTYNHSMGAMVSGWFDCVTFRQNLFARNHDRNPRVIFDAHHADAVTARAQVLNNVLFGNYFQMLFGTRGEGVTLGVDAVGNTGLAYTSSRSKAFLRVEGNVRLYERDNWGEGPLLERIGKKTWPEHEAWTTLLSKPVQELSALERESGLLAVLANAGARPLDDHDQALMHEVRTYYENHRAGEES